MCNGSTAALTVTIIPSSGWPFSDITLPVHLVGAGVEVINSTC